MKNHWLFYENVYCANLIVSLFVVAYIKVIIPIFLNNSFSHGMMCGTHAKVNFMLFHGMKN